jgi:hypothetical protein
MRCNTASFWGASSDVPAGPNYSESWVTGCVNKEPKKGRNENASNERVCIVKMDCIKECEECDKRESLLRSSMSSKSTRR